MKRVTAQTLQEEDDDNNIWDAKTQRAQVYQDKRAGYCADTRGRDDEKEEMKMQ